MFALYQIWPCTLFFTYLSLFCNTSCIVCHQRHKNPLFSIQLSVRKPVLKPSASTLLWLDRDWTWQNSIIIRPGSSLLFLCFGTGNHWNHSWNQVSRISTAALFGAVFNVMSDAVDLIWRPTAARFVVPTQWTTSESECLTCLHRQLLPRGNGGWWILSFLPVTHQKDNSSFLRSAHDSWKARLLNHFLAPPLLTAVLCHIFTGLVLWPDMSFFFFVGLRGKTNPNLLYFLCSLALSDIYLPRFCCGSSLSPPGSKALQVDCWLSPRSVVGPVQLNHTHLPHPWLSSPSLQLPS